MPTIQFRTDDQTKTASSDLFNKLGLTMSEAINMFLRQSIMRGGIPFTLNVPPNDFSRRGQGDGSSLWDDEAVIDAIRRYKVVNNNADLDLALAEPFLQAIQTLVPQAEPSITFYSDAVKVRLSAGGRDFVIDYNFEEPDSVFILSRKDGKLFVKDCKLADIAKILELFDGLS
jgi:antitoxin component of RelBE/YafQ-DinJ toxin-antitoxin module